MGVLEVPRDLVFRAVLRLCSKMERDISGEAAVSATLLSCWARELLDSLPVPDFGEAYVPSPEWDDQDRLVVIYRVVREMQATNAPVDHSTVLSWTFRLEAVSRYQACQIELVRNQIIKETIH